MSIVRAARAVAMRVTDAIHDLRHERFVRIGPLYITTFRRHFDAVRNGFEIGREYERGQIGQRVTRLEERVRELSELTA